jgi:hypothetical protein
MHLAKYILYAGQIYIVNILPSASFSLVFNAMEELKTQLTTGRPCLLNLII